MNVDDVTALLRLANSPEATNHNTYPLWSLALHATAKHAAHSTAAHAAKELRKQIFCGHTTTHATCTALQALLTILVVNISLLLIR